MPNNYSPTLTQYSGQGAFRFWCQKVLPLVYDDSLSYYELLNRVVNYLNNVITDVSAMGGNIDALLTAYVQLQDYVNDEISDLEQQIDDYFVNLSPSVTQLIENTINDWLDNHPEATTTVVDGSITYAKFNPILANSIYTLAKFAGNTNQEKLFNALDTIDEGVILCGEIEITTQYSALTNKDYRKITILGATITLSTNNWFDQTNARFKSVPQFDSCYIEGAGNTIYIGTANCVGAMFRNCTLKRVTIFNSNTNYIQSPYFIGCDMNPVENLITSQGGYDFKMIGCRVESATQTLIKITGSEGLRQGVIADCLIEGRANVVISMTACYAFSITDCYFEANLGGIFEQTLTSGACYLIVENCSFFAPIAGREYAEFAINIATANFRRCRIVNTLSNYSSGHYLCNKTLDYAEYALPNNHNYVSQWYDGSPFLQNRKNVLESSAVDGIWNSTDSTWDLDIILPYAIAYGALNPLYVIFAGSYGSSVAYQGFAIIRLTPRTGYNSSTSQVEIFCDAELVDSCNRNNAIKTSTASVSVELNDVNYQSTNIKITVKLAGFSSTRGKFRLIDPFRLYGMTTIEQS